MAIVPIEDGLFSMGTLHQAGHLARTDPAALTDLHLRHLVIYDAEGAERALRQRDAALDDLRIKALNPDPPKPPPAPPAPTGVTVPQLIKYLEAFEEAFAGPLVERFKADDERIKALSEQVATLTAEKGGLRDQAYQAVIDRAKHVGQLEALAQRCAASEARILELEAQRAADHSNANH